MPSYRHVVSYHILVLLVNSGAAAAEARGVGIRGRGSKGVTIMEGGRERGEERTGQGGETERETEQEKKKKERDGEGVPMSLKLGAVM